jgi:tetratricopeptide (TPR) repeat protein
LKLKYILLLLVISFLSSCGDYETEKGYVNKKNVDEYLFRLTKGYAFKQDVLPPSRELNDLEEYITARKDKIFKGESGENEYLLHKGLINLYRSEFIKAFSRLRAFSETTGEITRVYYNIGLVLWFQDSHSGEDIFGLAALSTRKTFPEPLDIDQQVSILDGNLYYPTLEMAPYILNSEEILNHHELTFDFQKRVERLRNIEIDKDRIDYKSGVTILNETQVQEILDSDLSSTTLKLDYAIAYYNHPYRADFEKAAFYADQRDYREWVKPFPSFRIPDLMRAYIGVGNYSKAIEIYEFHKEKYDTTGQSLTHLNMLVAAAYAGTNELEKSFEHISKEFSITEIRERVSFADFNPAIPNKKGDMLRSLFEVYFFFDEFRNYENTPWQEKFEDMVNRNFKRYDHLRLFNR